MQDETIKALGVLISGRGSNLLSLIEASFLPEYPFRIACVIASCDAEGINHAIKHNIPHFIIKEKEFSTKENYEKSMNSVLHSYSVDFVCLAGFMKILSGFFVRSWHERLINIHPSLLPSFKGLNAQKQALEMGVKISGCTVHFVDEGMDTGKIILQSSVAVKANDTVDTLSKRILAEEHKLYPMSLRILIKN